ncbi:MAG: hypothetical protein ACR2J3_06970 [Aridibacter sp.]
MKNLLFILLILMAAGVCYSQEKTENAPIVKADLNSCELNSLYIDGLRNEAGNTSEKVFVIVRKTKDETDYVNRQRLLQIRGILLGYKGFADKKVFFGESETNDNQGKVEFYLGGRLIFTALAQKNKRICWDCCSIPYNDYLKVPKPKKVLKKKQK